MVKSPTTPMTIASSDGAVMPARLLILFSVCLAAIATPVTAAPSDRESVVVIRAGQVITGTGQEIDNGLIVIIDGEIAAVGRNVEYPRTARVIDATDRVVMPGLIHGRTRFGLSNFGRSGQRANLKVADEIYPSLIDFDEMLRNGFTAAVYIPPGTGLPGQAAVLRTGGPEEHRMLRETAYLRVTMTTAGRDKATLRSALQAAQAEIDKIKKAREEWEKKRAEQEKAAAEKDEEKKDASARGNGDDKEAAPAEFKPPAIEVPLRPLVSLIQREPGFVAMIELNNASGLLHAEEVIARYDQLPVFFYLQPGSGDFHHVVERLGERKALVLTGPDLVRLPFTAVRYNLVAKLFNAGAEVAIVPTGSLASLRPQLAELVRSGLRPEDAMRAITFNTARIAGVEEKVGTIEVGKHADLIFLDSHPLDGLSKVTRTMIRGETVWSSGD